MEWCGRPDLKKSGLARCARPFKSISARIHRGLILGRRGVEWCGRPDLKKRRCVCGGGGGGREEGGGVESRDKRNKSQTGKRIAQAGSDCK